MDSYPQPGSSTNQAILSSPLVASPGIQTSEHTEEKAVPDPLAGNVGSNKNTSLTMRTASSVLGWMTPYEQMTFLRQKRDLRRWELFRDSLMRRWSNLNVICGLIMGAVSTIVFADFPLSRASFTLGIISLLSSLIAIGFGVGLVYVLGDVHGSSIVARHTFLFLFHIMVDDRHPFLHLFALSIPEVWAFISFGTFFADISVIVWEVGNKGWIVKAGVTAAAVALVAHLVAFGFLFREQDTTQFLIPDEPVFTTDEITEITEAKEATKSDEPPLSDSSLSFSKEHLGVGLQSSPKEFDYI